MWSAGRQGSGYFKLKLLESWIPRPWDIYLLKFPTGSYISPHIDPVEKGYKHWRMNITILKARSGGEFIADGGYYSWGPVRIFNPSHVEHLVTRVDSGVQLVLSFGLVLKDK